MRAFPLACVAVLLTLALPAPQAEAAPFRATLQVYGGDLVVDKGDMVGLRYDDPPAAAQNLTFRLALGDELLFDWTEPIWHRPWGSTSVTVAPEAPPGVYALTLTLVADTGETATEAVEIELVDENDAPMIGVFPPTLVHGEMRVSGFARDRDGSIGSVTLESEAGAMTADTDERGYFQFLQAHDWTPGRHPIRVWGIDDDGALGERHENLSVRETYYWMANPLVPMGSAKVPLPAGVEEGRVSICFHGNARAFCPDDWSGADLGRWVLLQETGFVRVTIEGAACGLEHTPLAPSPTPRRVCPFSTDGPAVALVEWQVVGQTYVSVHVDGVPTR